MFTPYFSPLGTLLFFIFGFIIGGLFMAWLISRSERPRHIHFDLEKRGGAR